MGVTNPKYTGTGSNSTSYAGYMGQSNAGQGTYWLSDDSFSQWMREMGGGSTIHPDMTQSVYESMSPEDWANFKKMSDSQQSAFIQTRTRDLGITDQNQVQADARKAQQDSIIAKVQAFADEMNMPIDQLLQHDDFAKALRSTTLNAASTSAYNRGLGGGGISNLNADQASKKALLGYQMQRQNMGQGALDRAYGMISNQGADAENLRRYEQNLNLQMQQAQSQAQQYSNAQTSAKYQGIGSLIGAAYGGQGGAQLGAAAGGLLAPQQSPYQYKYPTGNYGGGGMTSKSSYGGNY